MAVETAPNVKRMTLDVSGMTCASCVRRVEKALAKVPGVAEANVNFAVEQATVTYDPAVADVAALTAAVTKAGYKAAPAHGSEPAAPAAAPRAAVASSSTAVAGGQAAASPAAADGQPAAPAVA